MKTASTTTEEFLITETINVELNCFPESFANATNYRSITCAALASG
jgi:hypothetical protein